MVGKRRALVAVVATTAAMLTGWVLATQTSTAEVTPNVFGPTATDVRRPPEPLAAGDTERTSVSEVPPVTSRVRSESMISGNGRWDVFVSKAPLDGRPTFDHENVFVRDLADPRRTIQISLHN
ncbi:MAG TPA: hypothetical protein VKB75_18150, partial [Jatrophihabitans sp.]|nr:hypothetical protein [Jatrophihabitans sp.]